VLDALSSEPITADALAAKAGAPDQAETVFKVLEHLAANGRAQRMGGEHYVGAKFRRV
jgi:glucose-6-phosphate isomerase